MLSSALNRSLDPTDVDEIWFCLTDSISEAVDKTKSTFSLFISRTASKAAADIKPLFVAAGGVCRPGIASSHTDLPRERMGVATFARKAASLTASATRSSNSAWVIVIKAGVWALRGVCPPIESSLFGSVSTDDLVIMADLIYVF